ncbi:MAG: DUF5752 family protein, partial [Planctomycetota bacterium]
RQDDFRAWLAGWGEEHKNLGSALSEVDPYFSSLTEIRQELSWIFRHYVGETVLRRKKKTRIGTRPKAKKR